VANLQQFRTFFLKDQFFGVPVQQVQEVIRYQEMTRVPLTPQVIRGLINLRGQIVMAVDLRRRFAMEDRPASQLPMNVVVRTDDGAVSFLVDEIGDVLEVDEESLNGLQKRCGEKPANWCGGCTSCRNGCCWYWTRSGRCAEPRVPSEPRTSTARAGTDIYRNSPVQPKPWQGRHRFHKGAFEWNTRAGKQPSQISPNTHTI